VIPARPFAQKGITFKRLLQNLAWGGSPRSAPHAKFHRCGFKNVGLQPRIAKIGIFWYKFAQIFAQISPKQF